MLHTPIQQVVTLLSLISLDATFLTRHATKSVKYVSYGRVHTERVKRLLIRPLSEMVPC